MRSAVFQFLVVGALAAAWIWMLGRPLLMLFVRRTHRDSVSHFRHQQAVLGRSIGADGPFPGQAVDDRGTGFHPLQWWRSQPRERRRLQVMLGFGMATFASVLLALALRGPFVRLFLVMSIGFVLYLLVAASIGARELRAREAGMRQGLARADASRRVERTGEVERRVRRAPVESSRPDPEVWEVERPHGLFFDESFYDPIPEFQPIDRSRPVEPSPLAAESPGPDEAMPAATGDRPFSSSAVERSRPTRRPKARPIYIEADPDEGDESIRAVND